MPWPGWDKFVPLGPIGDDNRVALPAKSKYGNNRAQVGGEFFDSKREARRWQELLLLAHAGEISALKRQVRYELKVDGGQPVGHYVADFEYQDKAGALVVEDAKGHRTQLYIWKRRHMAAQYGIEIRET